MEPMTLGSPVGSPVAAAPHATPTSTTGSTFLPSYLMGDVASPALSGRLGGGGASPNKTTRQFSTPSSLPSPGSPQPTKDAFFPSKLGPDKPGGPPTQGLTGVRGPPTLTQSPIPTRLGSPYVDQRLLGMPGGLYSTPTSPLVSTPTYSTQVFTPSKDHSSFITQDSLQLTGDILEDCWVTVFGFPAAAASYILTQFTQLGTITEHHNPGSGNWMHLKYMTKLQARKALSKNGKVFSGNIMIGVVPCNDKMVTGDKENVPTNLSSIMSPSNTSLSNTPKSSMRPLTQAYQTVHAEHEVTPRVNTPKKNDSFVSRAMQHILGI